MAERIGWDKYETALLIDACERVANGVPKKDIVKELSSRLRKRAISQGRAIDDLFRNENGISLQMIKMDYVLTDGLRGLPGASGFFVEMVNLKRSTPAEFALILKSAKQQIDEEGSEKFSMKNRRAEFLEWINKQGKLKYHPNIIVSVLDESSEYAKMHGVSKISFWEMDNTVSFIIAYSLLSANKHFRVSKRNTAKMLCRVYFYYRDFLYYNDTEKSAKENNIATEDDNHTDKNKPKKAKIAGLDNNEVQSRKARQAQDTEMEVSNPDLYHKLYSVSKVFDDPKGLTVDKILSMVGPVCTKKELIAFLDGLSWVVKLTEEVYTFAKKSRKKDEEPTDYKKEAFIYILMNRYQSGMQFDSIDLDVFRDTYEDIYGEKLFFSDDELELRLKYCGIIYKDRLFPAEGIIDNDTKKYLFTYIENKLATGNNVLYYKAIFSDLSDRFVYCFSLTDEQMLKAYIEYTAEKGKYYFYGDYMSTEKNIKVNHSAEIEGFMLAAGKPLSYEEVYEGLSHISRDIIYREIKNNSKFLMNRKGNYYHIDIFDFSDTEVERIAEILEKEICENEYAIWSKVFEIVKEQLPDFIENNLYLSSLGIRNALSYYMSKQFDFNGEVISKEGTHLDMVEVFRLYAKHNAPFSDNDIYNFSRELDTNIYFPALSEEVVRVSSNLFVAKSQINFDIVETDKALETYLSSGYILVKDIDSFLLFPNVEYEWNEYLLESYLLNYSQKFCLINNGTSLHNVAGAVVKKDSSFTQFVDVCAHTLAESGIELKKEIALNYLTDINLLTRRSYKDLDVAITKAKQIRNMKG